MSPGNVGGGGTRVFYQRVAQGHRLKIHLDPISQETIYRPAIYTGEYLVSSAVFRPFDRRVATGNNY